MGSDNCPMGRLDARPSRYKPNDVSIGWAHRWEMGGSEEGGRGWKYEGGWWKGKGGREGKGAAFLYDGQIDKLTVKPKAAEQQSFGKSLSFFSTSVLARTASV